MKRIRKGSVDIPERSIEKHFRFFISDIFKTSGSNVGVSGRIESGYVSVGDSIMLMPIKEMATVKSLSKEEQDCSVVCAGDVCDIFLTGLEASKYT